MPGIFFRPIFSEVLVLNLAPVSKQGRVRTAERVLTIFLRSGGKCRGRQCDGSPRHWLSVRFMSLATKHEVTELLRAWGQGEEGALGRLVPAVDAELHRLAHKYMKWERPGTYAPNDRLDQRGLFSSCEVEPGPVAGSDALLCCCSHHHAAYSGRFRSLSSASEARRSGMPTVT